MIPLHTFFPVSLFIEQQPQSSLVETPEMTDPGLWRCFNLNGPDIVDITPITSCKCLTFPQAHKKQHVNAYNDFKSFYVSSASVLNALLSRFP